MSIRFEKLGQLAGILALHPAIPKASNPTGNGWSVTVHGAAISLLLGVGLVIAGSIFNLIASRRVANVLTPLQRDTLAFCQEISKFVKALPSEPAASDLKGYLQWGQSVHSKYALTLQPKANYIFHRFSEDGFADHKLSGLVVNATTDGDMLEMAERMRGLVLKSLPR